MKLFVTIFASLFIILMTSCTSLSNAGEQVAVVNQAPRGATYLGWVSQETGGPGILTPAVALEDAIKGLQNKTADLGGTHLVLDRSSRLARNWGFPQEVSGKAYRDDGELPASDAR